MLNFFKRQYKKFTRDELFFEGFILLMFLSIGFFGYQGRDLSPKSELQYITGTILKTDERDYASRPLVTIYAKDTKSTWIFGCEYGVRFYKNGSSCMSYKSIEEIFGETVTIGWYYDDGVLFVEPSPSTQLVTLEINGKSIISYQDTLNTINRNNRVDIITLTIFYFCYLVFIIFLKRYEKK